MKEICPFCNPDVIATLFAEDYDNMAIYNHAPIVKGHSLVVPKRHVTSLFDLSADEYDQLFRFARKVILFLNNQFQTNEFDMTIQQGENAGQSVAHVHLHIIPRKANDFEDDKEWYQKLSEHPIKTLDSNKLISSLELKEISDTLRQKWESTQK